MPDRKSIKLLKKYLSGRATAAEIQQVEKWYASAPKDLKDLSQIDLPAVKESIYDSILVELNKEEVKRIPFYNRPVFKVAAVLAVLVCAAYFFFLGRGNGGTVNNQPKGQIAKQDLAPPTSNKATITLSNGTKIELDGTETGPLATEGKIAVTKQGEGQIVYTAAKTGDTEIGYNTLSVPRGSKPMRLVLVDGSEVWLNVASSIKYPTAFVGTERRVEISGEAYFEVAKNAAMPFIVKRLNDNAEIKVLGTHFNVNSYDDDNEIKVTLLEGSVDASRNGAHSILKPGQQAQLGATKISTLSNVDLRQVMAWKDGLFYFDEVDIKTIMKQVEKWYDVQVSYESEIPYSFVAKISRNVNASELFKLLELTEGVHFRIEKNKVTVLK